MDNVQFRKLMNKILVLTEDLQAQHRLPALERDLLLSYIRHLYEVVLDDTTVKTNHHNEDLDHISHVGPTKSNGTTIIPKFISAEKVSAHIDSPITDDTEKKSHTSLDKSDFDTISPSNNLKSVPTFSQNNEHTQVLTEIFAEEKMHDLSSKLANTPIHDLTKAMSINEKIFTQQELFGNSAQDMNEVLQKLNQMSDFAEAKNYITSHLISKYEWTNEQKIKKASAFIKLIKRRYTTA